MTKLTTPHVQIPIAALPAMNNAGTRKRSATPIQNREKRRAVVSEKRSVVKMKDRKRKRGVEDSRVRRARNDCKKC